MTIVAQCPHCETRFNLQDDLVGKSMRCPNLECRQTFVVKSTGKPVEPPEPLPLPDEPEPPRPAKPRSSQKPGGGDPRKPRQEVVEAEVVEAAIVAPPNVKEVVWSEGRDVPPPRGKGKKPSRAAESDDDDDLPIIRRKKKKNRRPWILIGMSVTVLALLVFGGVSVLRHQTKAEETLAKQAKDAYAGGEYNSAQKLYRQLAEEYPKSDNVPEYDFFASLAVLQLDIRTATGGDPDKLVQQFRSFVAKYKDSPFAKPSTGRGGDIHDAGKKLAKDIVSFADGRVQKYREDRRKNEGQLANAQKSLATGRELLPMLDPFRGPDEPPLDDLRQGLDGVEKQVQREHARSEALASAAKQLQEPTDETIQSVEADLAAADFLDDEAQAIIARAKEVLRAMVKFEAQEEAPKAIPASKTATLLFMTPVGPTRRPPATAAGETSPPSVFLAIARGILYAVDEDTGTLKWAARVGADENDPPTVTRADLATGPTELALVASDVGGEPALAAYELGTGAAKWYQPLPAPAAGPAVVVGGRAYIAVRDREGSIFEFDITTGVRKGRIRIAQPIGPGLVLRPGTGLIYAAADARRVFVIDAGAKDDGGAPIPPRCVQVLVTMHPPGALRTPPVLLGPEGESDAKRLMILAQADGKLRAFELGAIQRPPAGVDVPPETIVNPQQELPIDGWVWFSPATDGERLALVTDRAEFRVFGVNQPGNHDRAIFPLPAPSLPSPVAGTAVRGLAIPAEESAFWVLANGSLQKFRVALLPSRGLQVVEAGPRVMIGEPTQLPQFTKRRDAAFLVLRSQNSAGCNAVLLSIANGELRWQRQLGVIPAAPPIAQGEAAILTAEDGGVVAIPSMGTTATGRTTVAPIAWVIGIPPEQITGPTRVARSADGSFAVTLTPIEAIEDGKPVAKYAIRRIEGGRVVHEGVVAAPGAIAGEPAIIGKQLLIPASDGFIYRLTEGTGVANPDKLLPGPPWTSGTRRQNSECSVTVISETMFLTNDGGRKLEGWMWPMSGSWSNAAGKWELPVAPAGRGVVIPAKPSGEAPRLMIADVAGTVRLFAADRGGEHLKQWRSGGEKHPAGKPSSSLVVQNDTAGNPVVAFTIENRALVCIDPERDEPRWMVKAADEPAATFVGAPEPIGAGKWLVTDLGGRVTEYDAEGKKGRTLSIELPGAVPARAAAAIGGAGILVPLSDGSVVVLSLPGSHSPAPPPKSKAEGEKN